METKYDISHDLMVNDQELSVQQQQAVQPQMLMNEEYPGHFNFQLIPDQQDDTKSWVYSPKLKKVFIEMEKTLPVRIKWNPMETGLYVRAVMTFCQPTFRSEPVTRCHNHIALSNHSSPYLYHVMSCKDPQSIYNKTNDRYSVLVPLGMPEPGSDSVQMDFTFHCKNSCSTGLNRRPTEVVFSLENGVGHILGQRRLNVRICSCPKRDREKEERGMREQSAPKKRKIAPGKKLATPVYREHQDPDSEIFTFSARIYSRKHYETLKEVAHGLMTATMIRNGQQAVIKPLLEELESLP